MDFAHLHLMLNHVPVFGAIFDFFVLIVGVLLRSKATTIVGLALLMVAGLIAIPVYRKRM